MADQTGTQGVIEARTLRFPGAQRALPEDELAELREGAAEDPLTKTALSVARPVDRALVLGGGSGLLPALLAGRLGLRHVCVVEPDPLRRSYLAGVLAANSLVRVDLRDSLPEDLVPTLLVADVSKEGQDPWPDACLEGLRAAVLRLPQTRNEIAEVFRRLAAKNLTYFPRQSSGDVVTFLSRWY